MNEKFTFQVFSTRLSNGKWRVKMIDVPVTAYGTSREEAYRRFISVYELYQEYGEDWMARIISEKSERYADADTEMNGNPWTPSK